MLGLFRKNAQSLDILLIKGSEHRVLAENKESINRISF